MRGSGVGVLGSRQRVPSASKSSLYRQPASSSGSPRLMDKVYEAQADTRQAEVVTAEPVVANEHMREVRAPPGPLGVSFDANDTSHRVIGVRPASPLARHVAVGDRLVRISTPGRAPLMCGPTVTGRDITDELLAGASSGGRVLSFAGYPLIPSAEIGGCYTFPCGVARWCSPCEDHVCGVRRPDPAVCLAVPLSPKTGHKLQAENPQKPQLLHRDGRIRKRLVGPREGPRHARIRTGLLLRTVGARVLRVQAMR